MNVIPVINCGDAACAARLLRTAETFLPAGSLIHLDVTDGVFATHRTWNDPFGWSQLHSPFPLEVHLMEERPEEHADDWLTLGASRLAVHVEAVDAATLRRLLDLADTHRAEIALAFLLDSDPGAFLPLLERFAERISVYHVLAVPAGPGGQPFDPSVADKISFLRQFSLHATIEVDGGMNPESAKFVKSSGADTAIAGAYIFRSNDPGAAYETLRSI